MFWVKWLALFAIPLVLAGTLAAQVIPVADLANDRDLRVVGMLLLGFALLSIILVFRFAQTTPRSKPARVAPAARSGNEFRRGFASAKPAPRQHRAPRPSEVVAWRRHRIEPRVGTITPNPAAMITPGTIASLTQRLHDRAEKLWRRQAG